MATKNDERKSQGVNAAIIVAIIGAIATISTGFLSYFAGFKEKQLEIGATQTAEARTPTIHTVVVIEPRPVEVEALSLPTPTPPGNRINFSNWQTDFCDDRCGRDYSTSASSIIAPIVPGRTYDAIEVIYDLRNSGWVLIKKNITPDVLAGTEGISFFYRGIGAPNSIELKLLLRYPGDAGDTTFGMLWNRATDTGDQWKSHQALYEVDFKCWGPTELCEKHDNAFDMESVHRIEFGISNKAGDTPGLGKITFDDLMGILR
jgi:hypothetical protein